MQTCDLPLTSSAAAIPGFEPLAHRVYRFLVISVELSLILLAIHLFKIEAQKPFLAVMGFALGGFLVHAWLPSRLRPAFFVVLSLAGIVFLLGWPNGAWVLGLGGGLLVLCHLPIPMIFRVLLIVVVGGLLAMWRVESSAAFWPVLGSMFMFRLMVYLYDLSHERQRPPLFQSLAYFFPLPNICFPLFPVIDFKTFRQTYFNEASYTVYQTGVEWIVRGLTHLLLYRFVKYYLLPSPHELRDLPHIALFLAANYALYLRVSGWFHIITGILHLFGFNLPRTHHNYFLASSFSDIWRRINIYWKDFMAKLFFFPAFFTLRRGGTRFALAVAGFWVFVATWLLHSYQMFWLLGELPLTRSEAFLWLTVGLLVSVNLLLDLRRAEKARPSPPTPLPRGERGETNALLPRGERGETNAPRPSGERGWGEGFSLASAAVLSLRIVGIFVLVSFFWACWTIPRFVTYLRVVTVPGSSLMQGGLIVLASILGVVAVGVLVQLVRDRLLRHGVWPLPVSFTRSATLHAAALLVLVAAGIPQVGSAFGPRTAELLATLRLDAVTPVEAAQVVQGYYEEIAEAKVQAAPLLGSPRRDEKQAGFQYLELTRPTDDFLERELIPGWNGEVAGSRLTVNRFGMRDREAISQTKPANTRRVALVGSSVVMGYGVSDDETFSRLLEERLNADLPDNGVRYEVLNFGAGMLSALQRRFLIEQKVFAFEPNAVYYVAHQDELLGPTRHLARLAAKGIELPYEGLKEIVERAGITPDLSSGEIEARLQPFAPDIVRATYAGLVKECRKRHVLPVWIYLPMPGITEISLKSSEIVDLAEEAGFIVANLAKWSDGYDPAEVKLSATDYHANARGHRIIAEQLYEMIRKRPELLPSWTRRER